jgi:polyhydroxyalkanoate synthase subunit PhaC
MTTAESGQVQGDVEEGAAPALTRLEQNLTRIEELSVRLTQTLAQKRAVPAALQGPAMELYAKATTQFWAEAAANPARLIEAQVTYWAETMKHYAAAQAALGEGKLQAPPDPGPDDRRFRNPLWSSHPWFNFIKQQYQMNAAAVTAAAQGIEGLEPADRKRLDYFLCQIVDMMAPTNFLATNPDALEKAVQTEGQSLIDGLQNLIRDIEANEGELIVNLADRQAFKVGENLATTQGDVVYRNRLFELIQYRPTTDKVHETPLIIFPPWINKFYILDLKPQNSLIKWIVDQGFTLFVVSWVNPGPAYRDTALIDYVEEGYLEAIAQAKAICGTKKVNAVGYCIAGTTLSLTLALMRARGDKSVNSATFFTTLTDFSDQGEVGVFLDNDFVDGIEAESQRAGVLDRFYMARTFSYLRSNDLIYQPAIKSYLMGEAPPAFDLLFWNGDGTNLPAQMAIDYLRGLCQDDLFAGPGFKLGGHVLRLKDVKVPLCAIACETDHIAAWTASYRGVQAMGSDDKTFILSESGHIAGIVNPPSKGKYGHWTNPDLSQLPEDWQARAEKHQGSWWPRWKDWLEARSGRQVAARVPGADGRALLGPAPGTYVTAAPGALPASPTGRKTRPRKG